MVLIDWFYWAQSLIKNTISLTSSCLWKLCLSIRKRVSGVCAVWQHRWHPEAEQRPRCHRLLALCRNRGNHCQLPSHRSGRQTCWRLPTWPCHLHSETQRGKESTECWGWLLFYTTAPLMFTFKMYAAAEQQCFPADNLQGNFWYFFNLFSPWLDLLMQHFSLQNTIFIIIFLLKNQNAI